MSLLHLRVQSARTVLGPRRVTKMRKEDGIARDQATRVPAEPDSPLIRIRVKPGIGSLGSEQTRLRPRPRIREKNTLDLLRSTVEAAQELHAGDPQASATAQRQGQRLAPEAHACKPAWQVGGLDFEPGQLSKWTTTFREDDGEVLGRFKLNALSQATIANDGPKPQLTEFGQRPVDAGELAQAVAERRQRIEVPERDVDQGLNVTGSIARKDLTVPDDDPAPVGRRAPVRRSLELDRLVDGNGPHGSDLRTSQISVGSILVPVGFIFKTHNGVHSACARWALGMCSATVDGCRS